MLPLITLNTPTRKRPANMVRLWESAISTAEKPESLEIVFYIDLDDSISQYQYKQMKQKWGDQINAIIGPRIVMSDMHNKIFEKSRAEITQLTGDDIVFKTPGWDRIIIEAFNEVSDKILFVHGDDLFQVRDFGTHGALHRNWFRVLGKLTPTEFSADFADTYLNDVAKMIGRHRTLPYITEHLHPSAGKAPTDSVYQENRMRTLRDQNDRKYYSVEMQQKRAVDAQKLSKFIEDFK